ncbi:hypothetical protein [Nannocystis punicea]|uniref:Uncharacterized protein n=1 Tax=Nannocystis punicea TaxID=2995304 RepID=A0ABY7H8Z4_9BACT|nr:hypothetical protein [Nannocystis poenicansa]WAS95745.1 hypothetical protein O0S08_06245 [Nannocystis poenicansa]
MAEKREREAALAQIAWVTALLGVRADPIELLVSTYLGQPARLHKGIVLEYQGEAWHMRGDEPTSPRQKLDDTVKFLLYEHPRKCFLRQPNVSAWPTTTGWLAAVVVSAPPGEIPFELEPTSGGTCAASDGDVILREPEQLAGVPTIAKEHQSIADLLLRWPRAHLSGFVAAFAWLRLRRGQDGKWKEVEHRREVRVRDPAVLKPAVACRSKPDSGTTWSVMLCPADVTLADFEGAFRWY